MVLVSIERTAVVEGEPAAREGCGQRGVEGVGAVAVVALAVVGRLWRRRAHRRWSPGRARGGASGSSSSRESPLSAREMDA